jgi:NAD(P)-dependent dehydrogenase (short-subunit alcohol dehydrogenase family)
MKKNVLITGGGSGIGQALANQLAKNKLHVYIVGRRLHKLNETQQLSPNFITPIVADISSITGRKSIIKFLNGKKIHYLIHNAAIVEPLKPIDTITLKEWRQHIAINLEGPLFLTQLLLPFLIKGARILNISSGLAHRALSGTAAYSISKAGLHMLYKSWNEELSSRGIFAGSVQPGIVDTDMQVTLRSDKNFTSYPLFKSLKKENKLRSPKKIANALSWMLLKMDTESFIKKEWRIDDEKLLQHIK